MKKRSIALMLVCAVMLTAVTNVWARGSGGKNDGKFIIATDTTFAPFEFQNA